MATDGGSPRERAPLSLVPDGETAVILTRIDAEHPRASERSAVIHPRAAQRFTSIDAHVLHLTERATPHGREKITFDVPDVDPSTLEQLDDDGVVRVGTRARPRMVIVGKVAPTAESAGEADPIASALGVLTGRDASLRCPAGVEGAVTDVERLVGAAGEVTVRVVIRTERPLAIGDLLRVGERVAIVGAIEPIDADAIWPGAPGTGPVEKIACASVLAEARSIGPYSHVTQQPLGSGRGVLAGQMLHEADVLALRAHGARHLLHELTTLKSDDVDARLAAYESIVRGTWRLPDSMPESTHALAAHLSALGLGVDFAIDVQRPSLATDATLRARAREVHDERTLDPSGRPVPGGLFCEEIFGALNDERGRRRIVGRIELPAPVLHPWLFEAAGTMLALSASDLDDVIFEGRTLEGERAERWTETGAWAIERALRAVEIERLVSEEGPRGALARAMDVKVPMGSFFPRTEPWAFVRHAWPVLPASLRPEALLDDGRRASSDLNLRYGHVVETARQLRALLSEPGQDAPRMREHARLQRAIDALVDRTLRDDARPVRPGETDSAQSLAETTDARGHFGKALRGKRADYSTAASVVERVELAGKIALPLTVALELFKPFIYSALEARGLVTTIKEAKRRVEAGDPDAVALLREVATNVPVLVLAETPLRSPSQLLVRDVVIWGEPAFGLTPDDVRSLGLDAASRAVVHLPLSQAARAEARALKTRAPRSITEGQGWIARASRSRRLEDVLVPAALAREADPVTDDEACLLLGRLFADTRPR